MGQPQKLTRGKGGTALVTCPIAVTELLQKHLQGGLFGLGLYKGFSLKMGANGGLGRGRGDG